MSSREFSRMLLLLVSSLPEPVLSIVYAPQPSLPWEVPPTGDYLGVHLQDRPQEQGEQENERIYPHIGRFSGRLFLII